MGADYDYNIKCEDDFCFLIFIKFLWESKLQPGKLFKMPETPINI